MIQLTENTDSRLIMKATIFNIQRFSVHDGDGIRTTVFFTGCPLACRWCHNPEGESFSPSLLYNSEKCVGCGACVDACPNGAILMDEEKHIAIQNFELCGACGECVPACLSDARSIAGKSYTVPELVKICRADRMFYEESGGGVTLSGGEVMAQDIEFILSLLKALDREGISVNIDTSGFAPWDKFQRILPYVDTFLYDIKSVDPEKHKYCTEVPNELILSNLSRLSDAGAKIYLRVPVIAPGPDADGFDGANYTDDDIDRLADVANTVKYSKLCLLPYHDTGIYKRTSLGWQTDREFSTPTNERMNEIRDRLIARGCGPVSIGS